MEQTPTGPFTLHPPVQTVTGRGLHLNSIRPRKAQKTTKTISSFCFVIFVPFLDYLGRGERFKSERAVSRGIPLATALQVTCARAAASRRREKLKR